MSETYQSTTARFVSEQFVPDVNEPLVSVVMPCLNEEEAIGACIEKIQRTFAAANISGEIIVCDNGSMDNSVAIAQRMRARGVH